MWSATRCAASHCFPLANLCQCLFLVLAQFSKEGRLSLFQLLLTRQALLPIPAGSWLLDRRLRCVELPFFDFVCQLDSAQCHFRIPKYLEPQHRVTPLLHLPVILLNHVIQVLAGPDERLSGQDAFGLQFGDGLMRRPTAVECDLLRSRFCCKKRAVCGQD
jgi:hypothetical protein